MGYYCKLYLLVNFSCSTICGVKARVEHATGKIRQKPWQRDGGGGGGGGGRGGGGGDRYGGGGGGASFGAMRRDPNDRCFKCGERGHHSRECQQSGRGGGGGGGYGGGGGDRSSGSRRRRYDQIISIALLWCEFLMVKF